MKRTFLVIMTASAISLIGCQKEDPIPADTGETKITELRSYTGKSPNPIDEGNYKLDKSGETLESRLSSPCFSMCTMICRKPLPSTLKRI